MVLNADTGIEPPLTEAAHGLVARLQGHLEPEGLRLAEGDLVRRREVGGDHNGAPLRLERTGAGDRGRHPRSASCSGSGARGRGFEGGRSIGRSIPSPEYSVDTLCRLAYAQVACRLWRSGSHLGCLC